MNKLRRHQKGLIALVVFATAALLLAGGVWAYDTAQKDQIAPGISVGGVDIGAALIASGVARELGDGRRSWC